VGRDLAWELPANVDADVPSRDGGTRLVDAEMRAHIRATMSKHVGVLRRPDGLAAATESLNVPLTSSEAHRRTWEATNILTVASVVVAAAAARTESRGCHRRTDHPEPREVWRTHLDVRVAPDADGFGLITVSGAPVEGGYL
jgi:L-aspartate oxidase